MKLAFFSHVQSNPMPTLSSILRFSEWSWFLRDLGISDWICHECELKCQLCRFFCASNCRYFETRRLFCLCADLTCQSAFFADFRNWRWWWIWVLGSRYSARLKMCTWWGSCEGSICRLACTGTIVAAIQLFRFRKGLFWFREDRTTHPIWPFLPNSPPAPGHRSLLLQKYRIFCQISHIFKFRKSNGQTSADYWPSPLCWAPKLSWN